MSLDCAELIIDTKNFKYGSITWKLHITVLAHFNSTCERTLVALKYRLAQIDPNDEIGNMAKICLTHLDKKHTKSDNIWTAIHNQGQHESNASLLLRAIENDLALTPMIASISLTHTLTLQFTPKLSTIMKFHKTNKAEQLYHPSKQ